jgi:hypothetical protein
MDSYYLLVHPTGCAFWKGRKTAVRGGSIIVVVMAAAALAGCAQEPQRRTSIDSPQWVGPLSEAEFDAFATNAAERLRAVLATKALQDRWIAPPAIVGEGLDAEDAGPEFAQRVAHGINDRLGCEACFAPTMPWPVGLASRLELRRDPGDGRLHATLIVHHPAAHDEFLVHSFATHRAAPTPESPGRDTLAGIVSPRDDE